MGGFGTCVIEACNEHGLPTQAIHRLGLPDKWIYQGGRGEQLRAAGIDAVGIARKVIEVLESPARPAATPIGDRARPAAPLQRKLRA
jgi:deoxyxylulose-5-phosphate synthase